MSTTERSTRRNQSLRQGRLAASGPSRRRWSLTATVVAGTVGLAGIGAALVLPRTGPSSASSSVTAAGTDQMATNDQAENPLTSVDPRTPVLLPGQVVGLAPLPEESDPTKSPVWQQRVAMAVPDAAHAAQGYGEADSSKTVQVLVTRADLSPHVDLLWAADAGTQVGSNRCTQNVQPAPGTEARTRPTVVVCWRTSAQLSAAVLVVTPRRNVNVSEGSAALNEVWASVART